MRPPVVLRWSCHAIVLAWGVLLLSQPTPPALAAHEPVVTARVVPMPERAPEPPAPLPEPEPEPAEAPAPPEPEPEPPLSEPAPTLVSKADFSQGSSLLDGGGDFPALSFSYERFPSFVSYARAMERLGARFVVVRARRIVGEVDLMSHGIRAADLDRAFSPRARDYTAEPALAPVARVARDRFGSGSVVMMLVPRNLDAGLFGGLARVLSARGEPHGRLREIRGRYEREPGGGVRLRVEQAVRRDGTPLPMDLVFDLDAIAGGSRS